MLNRPRVSAEFLRAWKLRLALVLVTWLALEFTARAGLFALRRVRNLTYDPVERSSLTAVYRDGLELLLTNQAMYTAYSASLGWTIRPGGASPPLYRANLQGLRADREYAPTASGDTLRIAAFGDSFTHGDDVANSETWEVALERALPKIEVLNFGVGAYGLDQAYLRWREMGATFHPRVVLIGYMTEDIGRNVNVYRPFYYGPTRLPLAKPRFVLQSDELVLEPNPASRIDDYRALLTDPGPVLRRFGEHDYYYAHEPRASAWDHSPLVRLMKLTLHEIVDGPTEPIRANVYNVNSEAFHVTTRLFDEFVREVRAQNATPLIVVFPNRIDFHRQAEGRAPGHQPLLDDFVRKHHDFVDVLAAFPECQKPCDLEAIIPVHFTPAGNRVIGEYLARALRARGLDRPSP